MIRCYRVPAKPEEVQVGAPRNLREPDCRGALCVSFSKTEVLRCSDCAPYLMALPRTHTHRFCYWLLLKNHVRVQTHSRAIRYAHRSNAQLPSVSENDTQRCLPGIEVILKFGRAPQSSRLPYSCEVWYSSSRGSVQIYRICLSYII